MLVLELLRARKQNNSKINCISQILTSSFISLILFFTVICQQYALKVAFCSGMVSFYIRINFGFFFAILHLRHRQKLKCIDDSLLKFIKKTEILFKCLVDIGDCSHLRESRSMSRSESQAKVPLVIKEL